jgi:hypothetical protein
VEGERVRPTELEDSMGGIFFLDKSDGRLLRRESGAAAHLALSRRDRKADSQESAHNSLA